jgi:hypothetical protein
MQEDRWNLLSKRNAALVGGALAAAAVVVIVLLTGGGSAARASTTSPFAAYPALSSNAPSGLPLVTSHPRYQPGESSPGPAFPAEPPEGALTAGGRWPVSSTIRRVSVSVPGISEWIAESYGGGVCVLVWDGATQDPAVDFSCSTPEDIEKGASVQVRAIPSLPGKALSAGVVPDSTTSVTTHTASGSTEATPVTDNAWAHFSEEGATTTTQGG